MTVYEFLKQAAQSHSAVVGGGRTDEIRCDLATHSITSGTKAIVENGCVVLPAIVLENGDTFTLDGLIDFDGDPYAEIERLYAQYKRSVPNRHEKLNEGYFKALSSDALFMEELMDNVPRPKARLELEGFILLASAAGLLPWQNPRHFFWQSPTDPDCIIYREWVLGDDANTNMIKEEEAA